MILGISVVQVTKVVFDLRVILRDLVQEFNNLVSFLNVLAIFNIQVEDSPYVTFIKLLLKYIPSVHGDHWNIIVDRPYRVQDLIDLILNDFLIC